MRACKVVKNNKDLQHRVHELNTLPEQLFVIFWGKKNVDLGLKN